MYIQDRLFSESTEQVLFSVLLNEDEYQLFSDFQEYLFSKNHKKEGKNHKKGNLSKYDSNVGLGRAILAAPIDSGGGLVGGYFGKKAADEADEKGLDEDEVLSRAKDRGLKAGAVTGGLVGIARTKGNPAGAVIGAGLGALGGRNAASVNTKARLRKRGGFDGDGFI